jgi:hypothetical protein
MWHHKKLNGRRRRKIKLKFSQKLINDQSVASRDKLKFNIAMNMLKYNKWQKRHAKHLFNNQNKTLERNYSETEQNIATLCSETLFFNCWKEFLLRKRIICSPVIESRNKSHLQMSDKQKLFLKTQNSSKAFTLRKLLNVWTSARGSED